MFFDSHAHYDDDRFDKDRDALLTDMHKNGVDLIVNAGASMESSLAGIRLAERYPFVYAAVGVHPHDAQNMTDDDLALLRDLSAHEKVVAIGEIGLDFYYDNSPRDVQRRRFKDQLALAKELHLPVIIHSREAAAETFQIIKSSGVRKGVIHCYSGALPMALDYIKLGFTIGIGGVVTYHNAKKTQEVAAGIPLESLLLETDCPYLSPVPNRGKRNDSRNLVYVADTIAALRGISPEDVASAAKENAKALFSISNP